MYTKHPSPAFFTVICMIRSALYNTYILLIISHLTGLFPPLYPSLPLPASAPALSPAFLFLFPPFTAPFNMKFTCQSPNFHFKTLNVTCIQSLYRVQNGKNKKNKKSGAPPPPPARSSSSGAEINHDINNCCFFSVLIGFSFFFSSYSRI